jgi:hypothetical protein
VTNTQYNEVMIALSQVIHSLDRIAGSCERAEARVASPSGVTPANAFAVLTEPDAPSAVAEAFEAEARKARAVRTNITPPGTRGQGKRGRR